MKIEFDRKLYDRIYNFPLYTKSNEFDEKILFLFKIKFSFNIHHELRESYYFLVNVIIKTHLLFYKIK